MVTAEQAVAYEMATDRDSRCPPGESRAEQEVGCRRIWVQRRRRGAFLCVPFAMNVAMRWFVVGLGARSECERRGTGRGIPDGIAVLQH